MIRRIYFSGLVLVLISAFMFIQCQSDENAQRAEQRAKLGKYERLVTDIKAERIAFEDATELSELLELGLIKNNGNDFYLENREEMRIYRFGLNGKLKNIIGNGKGKGPGEMLRISDFFIDGNHIWVLDSGQITLLKFKKTGEFIGSKVLKIGVAKLASQSQDKIAMLSIFGDNLFTSISKDLGDETSVSFVDDLIKDQRMNSASLLGNLEGLETGGFIYIPSYAGYLYYYNELDSLSFIVETRDEQEFAPSSVRQGPGGRIAIGAPDTKVKTDQALIADGKLYVLVTFRDEKDEAGEPVQNPTQFIDVYKAESGEYLHSFTPPVSVQNFSIIRDHFIVVSPNNEIEKYKMNQN